MFWSFWKISQNPLNWLVNSRDFDDLFPINIDIDKSMAVRSCSSEKLMIFTIKSWGLPKFPAPNVSKTFHGRSTRTSWVWGIPNYHGLKQLVFLRMFSLYTIQRCLAFHPTNWMIINPEVFGGCGAQPTRHGWAVVTGQHGTASSKLQKAELQVELFCQCYHFYPFTK